MAETCLPLIITTASKKSLAEAFSVWMAISSAKYVADYLLLKDGLKVLSSPFQVLSSYSNSFHVANEKHFEMPGNCFISAKGKHFLPNCALFQPLAGNDQEKKVKEEKHLVCNQSPIIVCRQENRCEMSFSGLVLPESKPARLKSSKWVSETPAMLFPCNSSTVWWYDC